MALSFHPSQRMVLMCDFNTGFQPPEMVKIRPVVVISPKPRRGAQLCIVAPLSATRPNPVEKYHHMLSPDSLPGKFAAKETWAKCDIINTVSLSRLDRVLIGKDEKGKRKYVSKKILEDDFQKIQKCIANAPGFSI